MNAKLVPEPGEITVEMFSAFLEKHGWVKNGRTPSVKPWSNSCQFFVHENHADLTVDEENIEEAIYLFAIGKGKYQDAIITEITGKVAVVFDTDELEDVALLCEIYGVNQSCTGSHRHNWMNTVAKLKSALPKSEPTERKSEPRP